MGNSSPSITYSVPVNNIDKRPNETSIYRNPASVGRDIYNLQPEVQTLHDVLRHRFQNQENEFLGRRQIDGSGNLENHFTWKTNRQVQLEAESFGSGLVNLGLCPEINEPGAFPLKLLGVYSKNTIEYIIADIGCITQCISVVPIYDTLGEDATIFAFRRTKMTTCMVTANHVEKLLKQKQEGRLEFLQSIIVPDMANLNPQVMMANQGLVNFFSFEQIQQSGMQSPRNWAPASPSSVYCFSFTSGTVGDPKGAFITHKNIVSLIPGVELVSQGLLRSKYSHLSYLPLAHVLERAVYVVLMYIGLKIGVYSGDVLKVADDAQILKPTVFLSVPRMYSKIYDGIKKNVDEQSEFKKKLFARAMESKLKKLEKSGSFEHSIYDRVIFSKIKAKLGGNVKFMITGSAPIDGSMLRFLKCAFCCPLLEGYGQTEGTGIEFVTSLREPSAGHVGGPQLQNEFKLVDVPEMNYFSTDRDPQGNPSPRGEIWVRGPNVIPGYYLSPEQTRETFTPDGWLMSGDVGQILYPSNALKIIDRKKNIFKLQQGEYIAPEKLENVFKLSSPLINEVFVYGDGMRTSVVGVVVMEPSNITQFAINNGIQGAENPMVVKDSPEFLQKLSTLLSETGRKNKLNSLEILKGIYVEPRPFMDNGLLTTTFKLKRHEAKDFYAQIIESLYAHIPSK